MHRSMTDRAVMKAPAQRPPGAQAGRTGRRAGGAFVLLVALLVLCVSPFRARGDTLIDVREVNAFAEAFIIDLDLALMGQRFSPDSTAVLQYGSWVGPDGWKGVLEGTYLGQPLEVTYEGFFTPDATDPTKGTIAYTSTGFWGDEIWTGGTDGAPALYEDPDASYSISALEGKVGLSLSGQVGVFSVGISGEKDFAQNTMKAELTAGVLGVGPLGNLFEAGGGMRLNQLTGKDESYVVVRAFFGLFERDRVVDRTQIWRPPTPPPPRQPPPPPPPPPPWPPYSSPDYPNGGSGNEPGFDPNDPNAGAYHYMYIANGAPLPSSLLLGVVGLVVVVAIRRAGRRA